MYQIQSTHVISTGIIQSEWKDGSQTIVTFLDNNNKLSQFQLKC